MGLFVNDYNIGINDSRSTTGGGSSVIILLMTPLLRHSRRIALTAVPHVLEKHFEKNNIKLFYLPLLIVLKSTSIRYEYM